jgi:hypothetical protein
VTSDGDKLGEIDVALLKALREQYPSGHFDEVNVGIDAATSPELLRALDFLAPKIDRRRRALSFSSKETVARWLDRVEGRPIGGLSLDRDRRGWCYVVGATGCTGAAG